MSVARRLGLLEQLGDLLPGALARPLETAREVGRPEPLELPRRQRLQQRRHQFPAGVAVALDVALRSAVDARIAVRKQLDELAAIGTGRHVGRDAGTPAVDLDRARTGAVAFVGDTVDDEDGNGDRTAGEASVPDGDS